jgi:hypothetical protein
MIRQPSTDQYLIERIYMSIKSLVPPKKIRGFKTLDRLTPLI